MSETQERIVTIFGGARCVPTDPEYAQAHQRFDIALGRQNPLINGGMRLLVWILAIALAGCAKTRAVKEGSQGPGSKAGSNVPKNKLTLAPGRIDSVNTKARYVVISFPLGTMPSIDTLLSVYRQGVKVAEVKVTAPQQNNFTAADIIAGECHVGDEVRSN